MSPRPEQGDQTLSRLSSQGHGLTHSMLLPARGPAKEVRACIQEILPVNKYLLTACLGLVSAEMKPPHPRPPRGHRTGELCRGNSLSGSHS